VLNNL